MLSFATKNVFSMSQAIYTSDAPKPIGPYSQAILSGGLLFVSGQLAIDPVSGVYVPATVAEETDRALGHIRSILSEAQMSLSDVVKTSIFLQRMSDFPAVNEVYARYFSSEGSSVAPARETIQVAALPLGAQVEISCIASRQ